MYDALVESVKVALENPFSHGRGRPAWFGVLTDSSGPTGFILEWCRLVGGCNCRVWRRGGTTARVQGRLNGVILTVNTCIQM